MQPQDLRPQDFSKYPPEARVLAISHLAVLQKIPIALLPMILLEVIEYDWRFPLEQRSITRQLDYLTTLQPAAFTALMSGFAAVRLPADISKIDWVNQPQRFSEQLSALLWSMKQIDNYSKAAMQYQKQLEEALVEKPPAIPRFTLVTVGQGAGQSSFPLFRPLLPYGVLFPSVQPDNGLEMLIGFVKERAQKYPQKYAHWYIDGGKPEPTCGEREGVTLTSYNELAPAALKELQLTHRFVEDSNKTIAVGPEAVQSFMATLSPAILGLEGNASDVALRHFEVNVLTQGAGTQVFSTTFVQWTAREALRRAQPVTMLARFAPRQRMAPMNDLLQRDPLKQEMDPQGSLIDADMGAYYTWINQGRLPGADQARFLVWHEGQATALAIAPTLPAGTTSKSPVHLDKVLEWMS